MNYYRVAKILNTHGLKGDLKLQVITDFDRFYKGSRLYILYRNEYIEVTINRSKDYKNGVLVSFLGMDDINLVEKYKNSELYVSEEDQGELSEGEYYFYELIGKKIINTDGIERGVVEQVEEVPQGYNLVFKMDGKTKRIPFIDGVFIESVTDDAVIIHEIEGLI